MNIQILEYVDTSGHNPYEKWFKSLDVHIATKVTIALLRMSQGNLSNIKWFSSIGEYRIHFGVGYRIYLAKEADRLIVLLGGGSKKGQQKDIQNALHLWHAYKKRKKLKR